MPTSNNDTPITLTVLSFSLKNTTEINSPAKSAKTLIKGLSITGGK